jgi:hypothetical protein
VVEDIDDRLARYLCDQGWSATSADRESWDALDSDAQAGYVTFAQEFLHLVLDELVHLAEQPSADLRDVARSAEYWLIEIRDRHRGTGDATAAQDAGDSSMPYDFELEGCNIS